MKPSFIPTYLNKKTITLPKKKVNENIKPITLMKYLILLPLLLTSSFAATEKADTTNAQKKATPPAESKISANIPNAFYHKKGYVISPYKPYNVLNVKHLKVGDYARDPSTALINPKTQKADLKTAKIFRIPSKPAPKPKTQTPPQPKKVKKSWLNFN